MFERLRSKGFQIEFQSHAEAILSVDFPEAVDELEQALLETSIPIEEIIAGGGGEAKGTQRLRRALAASHWPKFTFKIERRINDQPRESIFHEIDHVRSYVNGSRIALEIEWNNKDPFYDRDLENFKRLHADGAISAGIIVTRGSSLQSEMRNLVRRFVQERHIEGFDDLLKWGYDPTRKQRDAISKLSSRAKNTTTFQEAFISKFVADKFGEATTHWRKLEDRLHRSVGNPCPLVLIGLPSSIVTFGEGLAALAEVERVEAEAYGEADDLP